MNGDVVAHLFFSGSDDPGLIDLAAMADGDEDSPVELRAIDPRTGREVTVLAFRAE